MNTGRESNKKQKKDKIYDWKNEGVKDKTETNM